METSNAERWLRNIGAFALLLAILAAVHFVVEANPGLTKSAAQAAVFQWWFLAIVAGAGLFGVVLLNLTSLRGMWDRDLSIGAKLLAPLVIGSALGVLYVIGDSVTGYSQITAARMHMATIHIAWPMSVPIYFGGAILVSILYFLVLLPPVHWLVCRLLLKGRGDALVYWMAAIPLALVEPLTQGDLSEVQRLGQTALPNLLGDLAMNFGQVWFFRRAGFIACIAVRIGFYAVWHIVYPLL
jgi:hypothetical protein